jgi:predicted nucleic acid-binding protein
MQSWSVSGIAGGIRLRIYLDAPPVIYLVERTPGFFPLVEARLASPGIVLVASDLTRMECRVVPVRNNDLVLVAGFDQYFSEVVSQIVPLSRGVVDRATDITAEYGFRTPDSLHLAAAVAFECNVFLTNDHRLGRFRDIAVEPLTR